MALIIDAYNVLPHTHLLPGRLAEVGAAGLCRLIERVGVAHGRASVVCDGSPPGSKAGRMLEMNGESRDLCGRSQREFGPVRLIYAGGGKDADSLIEELITADTAPRRLFVVSDDHRIQRAAQRRGASVVSSADFVRRLASALKAVARRSSQPGAAVHDIQYWMEQFRVEATDDKPEEIARTVDGWLREFGLCDEEGFTPRQDRLS